MAYNFYMSHTKKGLLSKCPKSTCSPGNHKMLLVANMNSE